MKILIIEDNESLARIIKIGLMKKGYLSNYLTDGRKAEKEILFFHRRYDVILLDIMLPFKNGFEIYQKIRAKKISTPVIITTARDSEEDRRRAFNLGVDYYLTKPFAFKELLKWIHTASLRSKALQ